MKSKDIIIALSIILVVLIVGLYFLIEKQKPKNHTATCTTYQCGM